MFSEVVSRWRPPGSCGPLKTPGPPPPGNSSLNLGPNRVFLGLWNIVPIVRHASPDANRDHLAERTGHRRDRLLPRRLRPGERQ